MQFQQFAVAQLEGNFAIQHLDPGVHRFDRNALVGRGGEAEQIGERHRSARALHRAEGCSQVERIAAELAGGSHPRLVPVNATRAPHCAFHIAYDTQGKTGKPARALLRSDGAIEALGCRGRRLKVVVEGDAAHIQAGVAGASTKVVNDPNVADRTARHRFAQYGINFYEIVEQRQRCVLGHQWLEPVIFLPVLNTQASLRNQQTAIDVTPVARSIEDIERNGSQEDVCP